MTSLLGLLHAGYRGVTAQQKMAEVAGHNIANAGTPGYRRLSAVLTTMATIPGGNLAGVRFGGLIQARDDFLAREICSNTSALGQEQAMRQTLEALEPHLNDLEGDGLAASLHAFFAAAGELSADPSNLALRSEVLSSGDRLATRFRQVGGALQAGQTGANRQLEAEVGAANEQLARIATLNRRIAAREGAGADASGLRDERDTLVRGVSGALGLQVVPGDDGSVHLLTLSGRSLVQGDVAAELTLATAPGAAYPTVHVIHGDEPPSELGAELGGRVGGLLAARDDAAAEAIAALDQLAFDLAGAVNAVHRGGYGLDAGTDRAFFVPITDVEGAASMLALSPDVDGQPERVAAASDPTGLPGDNVAALALAALAEDGSFGSGTQTLSDALGSITHSLAQRLSDARVGEEAQQAVLAQIEGMHASRTGVSIEEELVSVTASQRALEAAARTVKAADELVQTVLQMV